MNNRFIILIGSYNNEEWVKDNINSVLIQNYKNFEIYYFDAASSDNTYNIALSMEKDDNRLVVKTSGEERQMKGYFWDWTDTLNIGDNDIVCILDGDDFLANEDVLGYLNEVYNKHNCWMTYGGMIVWNGGDNTAEPYPQNSEAPLQIKVNKEYRKDMWRYSHFRTCRGFLWNRINKEDWKSKHDGKFMTLEDLVMMYNCLEMCPHEKIFRVPETIYIWNNSKASRGSIENKVDNIGQIYEQEIRNRPKYPEVEIVSPTLAGGLGNQMFEIAAGASLAKDNNAQLIVNPNEHILPNQGRNVNTYANSIFSNIVFDSNPLIKSKYSWDKIGYKPIPYQPNIKLGGHYQSYKYFHHNRKHIQSLFKSSTSLSRYCTSKYIELLFGKNITNEHRNKRTGIQVRRGDYHKFPDHHPLLKADYYKTAVDIIKPSEILVFSDDIQWCKENFNFECPVHYIKDEDYVEFHLLSLCHNIVISNSSFGWWAAYLNNHMTPPNVYVPSTWFGKALIDDGFIYDDLILPEWNRI